MPITASQLTGLTVGRNPIARAARTRGAVENRVRSVFPATWPVSSEDRAIAKSARAAARPRRCLCQLRPAKWARPVPGAHRYPEKGSVVGSVFLVQRGRPSCTSRREFQPLGAKSHIDPRAVGGCA